MEAEPSEGKSGSIDLNMVTWKVKSFDYLYKTEDLLSWQKCASRYLAISYHVFMFVKCGKAEKE